MLRLVAPGLLCLLAAPAAAQPQPAQPVPLPPQNFVFPVQPTARAGGNEPRVVVAKVVDGALVYKTNAMGPVQREVSVTVLENGQPVTRKQTVTMMQPTTKDVSLPLDGLKVKDAAGKKVQPLSLELRLGDGKGVVLHSGPLPDAIRAMFKDDTLFVETPAGAGQGVMPAFTTEFVPNGGPPVGGLRVRPVVEGVPVPQPAPPPPAPPQP